MAQIGATHGEEFSAEGTPIARGTTSSTANGLNQYTASGGASLSYDGRGNLTNAGGVSFGYDIYNRMISAPSSVSFAYDPAGRLYEISAAAATRFLYDGATIIAEYDASGAVLRRYVHGLSGPMVWYEGAGTSSHRWLIPDERGSIIARDNAGSVTINTYDEYGQGGSSNAGRFQYVGLPWIAEAGVYQMGARAYSPSIGRWMQTDPILTAGGVNLYAYVGNDPVNSIDASGLSENSDCVRPTGTFICGVMPIGALSCSGNCELYQPITGESGGNSRSDTELMTGGGASRTTGVGCLPSDGPDCVTVTAVPIPHPLIILVSAGIAWAIWWYHEMVGGGGGDDDERASNPSPPADTAGTPQGPDDPNLTPQQQARRLAEQMGYSRTSEFGRFQGQEVFRRGNSLISRDVTGHRGGYWKVFEVRRGVPVRTGTYNIDLTRRIGP